MDKTLATWHEDHVLIPEPVMLALGRKTGSWSKTASESSLETISVNKVESG